MKTPPNPPAFPVPNDANVNGQEGMLLRDYFAAAALQGWLATYGDTVNHPANVEGAPEAIAAAAYALADAMLAARATGGTPEP